MWELLELLSCAILQLHGLKKKNGHVAVKIILMRLRQCATRTSDRTVARLLMQRVFAHSADIAMIERDFRQVIKYADKWRALARPESPAYYNAVGSGVRAHLALGKQERALKLLADAISTAMRCRVADVEVPALMDLAIRSGVSQVRETDLFFDAVRRFARVEVGMPSVEFREKWRANRLALLRRLRDEA